MKVGRTKHLPAYGWWLALVFSLFVATSSHADDFYDEVFLPNGQPRPQYAEIVAMLGNMTPQEKARFIRESRRRFSGDTPMAPMPRIITQAEYDTLAAGTRQRAEAIRRFLIDHAGKKTYRDRVIPGQVIDQILERSGEGSMWRHITPEFAARARFLYGPDIIRRPDGRFVVLEDNAGFVGAPGDVGPAREIYETMMPDLMARLRVNNDPNNWYADLNDHMRELANPPIGNRMTDGALVIFSSPPYGDKEDARLNQILKDMGAILVTPNTRDRRIVVEPDGAYVEFTGHFGRKYKKKIGFLWLNSEHAWADWNHPAIREKALVDEARAHLDDRSLKKSAREAIEAAMVRDPVTRQLDLDALERALRQSNIMFEATSRRRSTIPGLMDAILSGRVQTNYQPGMEFTGDKMFHSYMDDLIRFYLNEEPILPGAPTRRFVRVGRNGRLTPDTHAIDRAMANREKSVIKIVDGRGGDGVYIGPKMTDAEWQALRERIIADPARFIIQEYSHPSVVGERIVDIRMISFIDETGRPVISDTPWSRSNVREGGDGKVNMSQSGTLMNVFVVPNPSGSSCANEMAAFNRATRRGGRRPAAGT